MHGKPAPPAPDLEHMIRRLQPQLAAKHIVFAHLRLLQRRARLIPIRRRIRHGRIQPQREELVTQIVMLLDIPPTVPPAVRPQLVRHLVREIHQPDPQVRPARPLQHRRLVGIADKPRNHPDQILRLPQPVHIRLPKPDRPVEHARPEKFHVLDPNFRPRLLPQPAENLLAPIGQHQTQSSPLHARERGKKDRCVVHVKTGRKALSLATFRVGGKSEDLESGNGGHSYFSAARSRRIFRANSSLISRCRGTGCVAPVCGL